MLNLLKTFVEIAVWRKGPQDLPASRLLATLVLLAYLGSGLLGVRLFALSLRAAAISMGVEIVMLSAWLYLVLAFFSRRQRFVQTITATLGVGVLIQLLDIVMRALQVAAGMSGDPAGGWPLAHLIIFSLVMGRIFMQALDRGLITGIALNIAIVYSTAAVAQLALDKL